MPIRSTLLGLALTVGLAACGYTDLDGENDEASSPPRTDAAPAAPPTETETPEVESDPMPAIPAGAITEALNAVLATQDEPRATDVTPTVRGIDDNDNGVRDDIETILEEESTKDVPPEQVEALREFAVAFQSKLEVDVNDEEAFLEAHRAVTKAVLCDFEVRRGDRHTDVTIDDIIAFSTNTPQRWQAYRRFEENLNGRSWGLGQGDPCSDEWTHESP